MLQREDWIHLARKLDWDFSYVSEREVFPEPISGSPWLEHAAWQDWEEPYRTSFCEYVALQHRKEASVQAVRAAIGKAEDFQKLDRAWLSGLKLHTATLALAEFAAVVGNLRAARFGRDSAWRFTASFGALDELRHTQIPLALMHDCSTIASTVSRCPLRSPPGTRAIRRVRRCVRLGQASRIRARRLMLATWKRSTSKRLLSSSF